MYWDSFSCLLTGRLETLLCVMRVRCRREAEVRHVPSLSGENRDRVAELHKHLGPRYFEEFGLCGVEA